MNFDLNRAVGRATIALWLAACCAPFNTYEMPTSGWAPHWDLIKDLVPFGFPGGLWLALAGPFGPLSFSVA
jgi:hypothetical protein